MNLPENMQVDEARRPMNSDPEKLAVTICATGRYQYAMKAQARAIHANLCRYAGPIAIILVGSMTDDEAVWMTLRRGFGWVRYAWHRQLVKEAHHAATVGRSPQPPIRVNPETDRWARSYAKFYAGLRPKPDRATEGARGRGAVAVDEAEDNGTVERLA